MKKCPFWASSSKNFEQEETPSRPRLLRGETTCWPGFLNREYFHESRHRITRVFVVSFLLPGFSGSFAPKSFLDDAAELVIRSLLAASSCASPR